MSELFVINDENNICFGIYTHLETVKKYLKNIFKKTPDFKHYGYKIQVYNLIGNEYIPANKIYTYSFDKIIEN